MNAYTQMTGECGSMKAPSETFKVDLFACPDKCGELTRMELIVADKNVYDQGVQYYRDV